MTPRYGAFYASWSLYLRSAVLRASGSGPLILGFSGPASVLGVGAAIVNGDQALATTLLATIEVVGLPVQIDGARRYAGGYLPVGDAFLAWARSAPAQAENMPYAPLVPAGWRLLVHAASLLLAGALGYAAMAIASPIARLRRRPLPFVG